MVVTKGKEKLVKSMMKRYKSEDLAHGKEHF
jgi:hypothetical protein